MQRVASGREWPLASSTSLVLGLVYLDPEYYFSVFRKAVKVIKQNETSFLRKMSRCFFVLSLYCFSAAVTLTRSLASPSWSSSGRLPILAS